MLPLILRLPQPRRPWVVEDRVHGADAAIIGERGTGRQQLDGGEGEALLSPF
jgi:hypothetical protein